MKILIIEDNKDYSKQLADKLKEKGFDPKNVTSLSGAEKELEQTVYNMIFINWSLAKEKTVQFIHEVKKSGRKSSVIVLSDTKDKYDEITALNGGADPICKS